MRLTRFEPGGAVIAFALLLSLAAFASGAESPAEKEPAAAPTSLTTAAPELLAAMRRYPDFFGSPWHREGGFLERSSLTGDWGGARQDLVDLGINLDVSLTQVFQSNVSGGVKHSPGLRYAGSGDLNLSVDTDKLGLWPGGLFIIHGEVAMGTYGAAEDAGVLIPVNSDSTMPRANDPGLVTLSEFYLIQALHPKLLVLLGKVYAAGLGDTSIFANNERTQFLNTSLVNNPVLGNFAPYTSLGGALVWTPDASNTISLLALDPWGSATRSGFDTAFSSPDGVTVAVNYQLRHEVFADLPGSVAVLAGYSSKNFRKFGVDRRYLLGNALGLEPVIEEDDNYGVFLTVDQHFYVEDAKKGTGLGMFARYGWSPSDRNALDQFVSLGIGGKGCLIPGRDHDRWGVGWGGTHLSEDLRDDLDLLTIDVDGWEHAFEVFYNVEITPAVHLTLDAQYVLNPVAAQVVDRFGDVSDADDVLVLGMRLQIDF